jgi:hypothetical protein
MIKINNMTDRLIPFLSSFFQQAITLRMRTILFRKMLRQPAAWYDEEKHSHGTLMQHLGVDSAKVMQKNMNLHFIQGPEL